MFDTNATQASASTNFQKASTTASALLAKTEFAATNTISSLAAIIPTQNAISAITLHSPSMSAKDSNVSLASLKNAQQSQGVLAENASSTLNGVTITTQSPGNVAHNLSSTPNRVTSAPHPPDGVTQDSSSNFDGAWTTTQLPSVALKDTILTAFLSPVGFAVCLAVILGFAALIVILSNLWWKRKYEKPKDEYKLEFVNMEV